MVMFIDAYDWVMEPKCLRDEPGCLFSLITDLVLILKQAE